MMGDFLSGETDYHKEVLHCYIDEMNFAEVGFVHALKSLLKGFRLPGEGQKVDRIMEKFGEKYMLDNPSKFDTAECVYLLSYATIMC